MGSITGVSTGSPAYGFRPNEARSSRCLLSRFSLSRSFPFYFSSFPSNARIVRRNECHRLLTEKRHELCTRDQKLTQLLQSSASAGATGLDYQHGVAPSRVLDICRSRHLRYSGRRFIPFSASIC